jgi:hypothetical protein
MASQLLRHSLRAIARTTATKPLMARTTTMSARSQLYSVPMIIRPFSVAKPCLSAGEGIAYRTH